MSADIANLVAFGLLSFVKCLSTISCIYSFVRREQMQQFAESDYRQFVHARFKQNATLSKDLE